MGDANYWGSLWVIIVFILLSLVIIVLGAQALGFLYDRISVWPVWNSPIWLKLKIPLIVIGVIGFIAGVIAFSRYQDRKEMQSARDYALVQGWGFSRNATKELETGTAEILSNLSFTMQYIRTIETGQRSLYLFNCSYKNRSASGRKNYSYGVACLIESKRFRPAAVPIEIVTRDWTEVMISDRVDMGSSPFTQQFLVLSKDPAAAKEIVNGAVQATMLEHSKKPLGNPVSITIGSGGAVILTDSTNEPERLQDLIDLARRIEAAVE